VRIVLFSLLAFAVAAALAGMLPSASARMRAACAILAALALIIGVPVGVVRALHAPPASAAVDAVPTVQAADRCRSPRITAHRGEGSLDLTGTQAGGVAAHRVLAARAGDTLILNGWASLPGHAGPARGVCIAIDGRAPERQTVRTGIARADVAQAFGAPALADAGFDARVPLPALGVGAHRIELIVLDGADGTGDALPSAQSVVLMMHGGR